MAGLPTSREVINYLVLMAFGFLLSIPFTVLILFFPEKIDRIYASMWCLDRDFIYYEQAIVAQQELRDILGSSLGDIELAKVKLDEVIESLQKAHDGGIPRAGFLLGELYGAGLAIVTTNGREETLLEAQPQRCRLLMDEARAYLSILASPDRC